MKQINDINKISEIKKIKESVIGKIQRLQNNDLAVYEIQIELEKDRDRLNKRIEDIKQQLKRYTGGALGSPIGDIEAFWDRVKDSDPERASAYQVEKNKLENRILIFLGHTATYEYEERYKSMIEDFQSLKNDLGFDIVGSIHFELSQAFKTKHKLTINYIKRMQLSQIILDIEQNGIEGILSNTTKTPLEDLNQEQKKKLDRALAGKDSDGRSKYTFDEYRIYLAIHLITPTSSRRNKAKEAAQYLSNDKAERMKETPDSRLSDWEDWLY